MKTLNNSNQRIPVRVQTKRHEARDICSLELVPISGELPARTAGAHVDVFLPNGLVRQYSLHNDPAETGHYGIAVLRETTSRGGSACVHEGVNEGDVLDISAPRNHFPLQENAPHSVLVAGGIGVTPIIAMADRLASVGASFRFIYCARTRERAAFPERLARSSYADRVLFHYSEEAGKPFDFLEGLRAMEPGTHLYVCGPQGFIDAVLGVARTLGWAEDRLHWEFFANSVAPAGDRQAFELELVTSGRTLPVAAGQSALEALQAAGVDIPSSCEQGVCGTCLTPVLGGTPDHRDQFLTPQERSANDCFLPCCSRSLTPRLQVAL